MFDQYLKPSEAFPVGSTMSITRRTLDLLKMSGRVYIDREALTAAGRAATFDAFYLPDIAAVVVEVNVRVAADHIEDVTVRYPRDWWEAFKERWFPAWATNRWPVQYTVKGWDGYLTYPDFVIPGAGRAVIQVIRKENP